MRAEVRRDRNHPSVIMYSIGNEVPDQDSPDGIVIGKELTAIIHEEDPTRPSSIACSSTSAGYTDFAKAMDVFGYNYRPGQYAKWRKEHPAQPFFASETASTVSSRGEYFFPLDKAQAEFQVSSYDLWKPGWATLPETEFKGQDENPFVAGEFVWTGFDYLGEPTPYQTNEYKGPDKDELTSRSSYFGIIDLAGFKKDRFYLYQARWRPDFPMAHILPHWNWPGREGQVTPVHVYTSGHEAELFLNGKSLGRKQKGQYEYRLRWDQVAYEPGELKVVAYKDGKEWAQEVMKTTGPATKLKLSADRSVITADGLDLSFVTVSIADKDGLPVPRSNNLVNFEISGPGEIVAVDNGDATSFESFQTNQRKAYNGLALVIIRAKAGLTGVITLKAGSEGLQGGKIPITSR